MQANGSAVEKSDRKKDEKKQQHGVQVVEFRYRVTAL